MTSYKIVDFKILGYKRGFHAYINFRQIVIAVKGICTFVLEGGNKREEIKLDILNQGLFIKELIWREMKNFSPDVLSEQYDESDYIRNYDHFLKIVKQ